jgi:hypothetical protein
VIGAARALRTLRTACRTGIGKAKRRLQRIGLARPLDAAAAAAGTATTTAGTARPALAGTSLPLRTAALAGACGGAIPTALDVAYAGPAPGA